MTDAREELVARLRSQGITDERVLSAVARVPRERFVDPDHEARAYDDTALAIGRGQTISSPWIVAASITALGQGRDARVLEIGTGSGYAAAVLAECVGEVVTVERDAVLADDARALLRDLSPDVRVLTGDGVTAAAGFAPFDGIVVTAMAYRQIPPELIEQLTPGGTLVCPVGDDRQGTLIRYRDGETTDLAPVSFVPLVRGTEG
ncbi:protein-L-isoaspartate(D-aspartate) O-methyltransferase [Pseudonocardia parietis]|uniref:Protein-L-isoaspartate O-methyltransferase n=1 Tax=Pseudonocardia parietis TaxID=570936 RepID=A0ABS4VW11_9PSEU|nr:protein-L-isoaspartate(D-aspartate) O-methyltransferase [Pseudonocardia parietis]MBP2367913.1 protein-L-isoaspartate(D-aspartate) O-methyltransferase [Pseudonocardia parietis]